MLKVFATDVVVSKGYDNAPALKFGEKGDSVRFRIGKKVYDARAEGNTRWPIRPSRKRKQHTRKTQNRSAPRQNRLPSHLRNQNRYRRITACSLLSGWKPTSSI